MSPPDLRLIVITDRALAAPRSIEDIVRECLGAGAPAIQLRDKHASAAELLEQATRLRELTAAHGALLFINDRLDVARAAGADGVHFGPDDLQVRAARAVVPSDFMIGYSTDRPELARANELDGATYIGCGAVYGTASKAGLAAEKIGPAGLRGVVRAVGIPVIAIGGITPENVHEVAAAGAAGCAAISAIMAAPAPGQIVRRLLDAFTSS
ncbi:MAG TPA: thiamine phosphate synthase [Longimicrobiales bacterium]|nr:thiamine phosphate synthase [Longimicrobiales bacterium]